MAGTRVPAAQARRGPCPAMTWTVRSALSHADVLRSCAPRVTGRCWALMLGDYAMPPHRRSPSYHACCESGSVLNWDSNAVLLEPAKFHAQVKRDCTGQGYARCLVSGRGGF